MSEAFMRVADREKVLAALERWALMAPVNQIGPWGLVRPEQRQEMAEYLLAGPVGAALDAVGVIVE